MTSPVPARSISAFERPRNHFRFFDTLVVVFITILLISNLVGQKICAFGPFRVGGAQLLFPLTYIFGDIFTEVYGYAASRRAIWLGFFGSALMALMGMIVVWLPPAPDFQHQDAMAIVFGMVPRMVAASLTAFWAGEFANSYVMARMKVWTKGKALWTRTVGSTAVGQLADSVVFMLLAFGGQESAATIANLIISGYVFKVVYEVLATPMTYLVVNGLKRAEGIDVFDVSTNFSPFAKGQKGEEFLPFGESLRVGSTD